MVPVMKHDLDLSDVPGKPVLVGVGGSHAYGLATAESDIDYRGVYVIPTSDLFGLTTPPETYDRHNPDCALHEVAKFLRLASAANPTVLEVLYYNDYPIKTEVVGQALLDNRDLFITSKIRATHIGYASAQFERLKKRQNSFSSDTAKRTAKHARHLLRLLRQAEQALTTGKFDLAVLDREEIFAFGELEHSKMVYKAEREILRVKNVESILPEYPDMDAINNLLISIRWGALEGSLR